jgi:hypothetical protein
MRKLTPKELRARRQREADEKTYEAYSAQFGSDGISFTGREVYRLMANSLVTGVDKLSAHKRKNLKLRAEHDAEHAEFLEMPITAVIERQYTRMIKRRRLYEGACDLSWPMYFKFREQRASAVEPLDAYDLAYAAQWTCCALPVRQEPTATEAEQTDAELILQLMGLIGSPKVKRLGLTISFGTKCAHCGTYFAATRTEARTCSTKCRVAHHRKENA